MRSISPGLAVETSTWESPFAPVWIWIGPEVMTMMLAAVPFANAPRIAPCDST
jgi:hypothetical protein